MRGSYSLSAALLVIPLIASAASGQTVISARAGMINYSEGAVFIGGQPVERRPGLFQSVKEGSDLTTQEGRAEILLTPNTWLRVATHSAIRMLSTDLSQPRVELLHGSAILDVGRAPDEP